MAPFQALLGQEPVPVMEYKQLLKNKAPEKLLDLSRENSSRIKTFPASRKIMESLLMLLLLSLVLTAPCCCGGDTNQPLDEGIKINKKTANTFVRRQKRAYPYYERYHEMFKSPMEMKQEQCENYAPCDYYSEIIGFQAAYGLIFGRT